MKIIDANKGLEARLTRQTWVLGTAMGLIATGVLVKALTPFILTLG